MKIRCLNELEDALDKDFAWRKKELTMILQNYKSANPIHQEHFQRAAIIFIYAHWEGFIKHSSIIYLTYLQGKSLRYSELKSNFAALTLMEQIDGTFSSQKILHKKELVDFLLGKMDKKFNVDPKTKIDTHSNLNIETLIEICTSIGIEEKEFISKKVWIDERLLAYRNQFSHGERLNGKLLFKIEELKDEVQNLLELYRNLISNAASMKMYLKDAS